MQVKFHTTKPSSRPASNQVFRDLSGLQNLAQNLGVPEVELAFKVLRKDLTYVTKLGETFAVQFSKDGAAYEIVKWNENQLLVCGFDDTIEDVARKLQDEAKEKNVHVVWTMIGRDEGLKFENIREYTKAKFRNFVEFELKEEEYRLLRKDLGHFKTWSFKRENCNSSFLISISNLRFDLTCDVAIGFFEEHPTPAVKNSKKRLLDWNFLGLEFE